MEKKDQSQEKKRYKKEKEFDEERPILHPFFSQYETEKGIFFSLKFKGIT